VAKSRLISAVIALCKDRANKVNDDSISRLTWLSYIHELYGEGHTLIVEKGARYFDTEASITATGAASYALPTNHLTTREIARVETGSSRRYPVRRIRNTRHRTHMAGTTGAASRYDIEAGNIVFYPNPSSGTYKHLYATQPTDLTAADDADNLDLICESFERFIVWGVAAIALHKGDANQQRAVGERERAREQLEYWATLRALEDNATPYTEGPEDELDDDPGEWTKY
jgi:hypothetical protein